MLNIVYKGANVGGVKSAKFMARKLQVQAFCGACTKIVSQVVCEDRERVQEEIHTAMRACVVDDSKVRRAAALRTMTTTLTATPTRPTARDPRPTLLFWLVSIAVVGVSVG